jgi:hypothetical protein
MKDSVGRFDLGGIGVKDSIDSILARDVVKDSFDWQG